MAGATVKRSPTRVVRTFMTLGHSLSGSYGAKSDVTGWPSRVAAALGAELFDRHVDGAVAAWDDTLDAGDGGYFTAASYLDPKNTTAPYVSVQPLVSIYLGHNDYLFGGFIDAAARAAVASMRGCIGHARCATRYLSTDATVRKTGANEIGAGTWANVSLTVTNLVGGTASYTTAVNDEVHIDVPADFPGGAIWIFTLTGGGSATTLNGAVSAGATSVVLTSAAGFPNSGRARIMDAGGTIDSFTYTAKSTNTLTGVPASGADAVGAHLTAERVMLEDLEGGLFTVDVDGALASPPAGWTFDTRSLGIPSSPSRIAGHGWRIPIAAAGAHEVTIKVTALLGGATPFFYFNAWGIEAEEPPIVMLPMPIRGAGTYPLYAPYTTPPTDARILALRPYITGLAAEFDDHVFTIDADAALNKTDRYFYRPLGTTNTVAITANAASITVADTTRFPSGGTAYVTDAGADDVFTYTAKTATTLTGIPTSGANVVLAHAATGLQVRPADSMHLSDIGHEVAASAYLGDITRKLPNDTRAIITSQGLRSLWVQRDPWKEPCRAASTGANIAVLTPPTTLDGLTLARGDRLLLKDQTIPSENGIYLYVGGSPPLIRDYDSNTSAKFQDGVRVAIVDGAINGNTEYALVSDNPIVLGTTSLRWRKTYPIELAPYRSAWEPADTAARPHVLSNVPRWAVQAATIAPLVSGRLTLVGGITIPAGQTITAITFISGTIALATGTNQWFCLLTTAASPVVLQRTASDGATAWAASTAKTLALQATYTPDGDVVAWVGIMVAATTVPNLLGLSTEQTGLVARPPFPVASSSTAQTTPPAVGTVMTAPASLTTGRPYVLLT